MSTDTLSLPVTPIGAQRVGVVVDEITLRKNLRSAFANSFTVVQELLQNARRAGATRIDIQYDETSQALVVQDDGCGLEDFSVLLRYAASGWDQTVQDSEGPYGMGFLACLYAAQKELCVVSGGRQLRCSTTALLEGESFPVEPAEEPVQGTRVELVGVELSGAKGLLAGIAKGFAVPLFFNGQECVRSDAEDTLSKVLVATTVGSIWVSANGTGDEVVVYLQGFQVYSNYGLMSDGRVVVHLSGRFKGKFPDRDRVIDEAQMLAEVRQAIRGVLVARLETMRQTLTPLQFCTEAYELAKSLGRLEVFNDIGIVPAQWFERIVDLPRSAVGWYESRGEAVRSGEPLTAEAIAEGKLVIAKFDDGFQALSDACSYGELSGYQRYWMMAHALKALMLSVELHEGHWLHPLIALRDGGEDVPSLVVDSPGKSGKVPYDRTERAGGLAVQTCAFVTLRLGDLSCEITEPWVDVVAGEHGDEPLLLAPFSGYVSEDVLRQFDDYRDDNEQVDGDALRVDEREVNQYVRELMADSPKGRLELALQAALADYRQSLKGFTQFSMDVDVRGQVKLTDAQERQASAGEQA